ncbi:hemolysin III family protein [Hyphomicrobium sp. MC1]|uniref:PAQR family membrane homeostasis protein TrhA n=1 Tax=Hyphomicrobium sp. (strain MC1) TaxID=717785 RepID=UPI000213E6A6|nr:hemolysin III family protein [Hyphomicrobium sp. MC1]CCB66531.1 Hly-III family protein [Hyphomicrobium sp. MC1]
MYTPAERIADGIVHIVGICAGVVAVIAMMVAAVHSLSLPATASLAIYSIGLLAMFGFSAAYNLLPTPNWKGTLRRLDQSAIFLKIAGTYTPFALIKMGGIAGYSLLTVVWVVALLGAAGKLLLKSNWNGIDVALYLALGWAGLVAIHPLAASVTSTVLALLGIGGVLYSVGVIFHVWHSLKYQNAIWHAFVLAATCCHFGAVTTAMFA